MKGKFRILYFFIAMTCAVVPIVTSSSTIPEQPEAVLGKGYLLIHVFSYSLGSGFYPYEGANISVRGFLYSYNGTTDEYGDCLFTVKTNLFRPKIYFVQINIDLEDRVVIRRGIFSIFPREIEYRQFLFIQLE